MLGKEKKMLLESLVKLVERELNGARFSNTLNLSGQKRQSNGRSRAASENL